MIGPRRMGTTLESVDTQRFRNDAPSALLEHRNSTKLLINRYEALSTPPPFERKGVAGGAPLRDRSIYRAQGKGVGRKDAVIHGSGDVNLVTPSKNESGGAKHRKERSPLRQSLRNLLSVIKKGTGISRRKHDDKNLEDDLALWDTSPPGKYINKGQDCLPDEVQAQAVTEISFSGTLTHLAQSSLDSPLPIWIACSAFLRNKSIVLSWFTSQGKPYTYEVDLLRCSDIRSLSIKNLDPAEAAVLPKTGDGKDLRVFELLFEGRGREKFAAISVRERASWISAIWDSILPTGIVQTQEQLKFNNKSNSEKRLYIRTDTETLPPLSVFNIESPIPTPIPIATPLLSPTYSDRALPPLPPCTPTTLCILDDRQSKRNSLDIPPSIVSQSIYSPSPSPRPLSRCSSPSVVNLDRLSVVKQRLAQLESIDSSASSGVSPPRGSVARYPLDDSQRTGDAHTDCSCSDESVKTVVDTRASLPSPRTGGDDALFASEAVEETRYLVSFLKESTDNQSKKTAELANQMVSMRDDLQKIPLDLATIKNVLGNESGCPTILQVVLGLDHRLEDTMQVLGRVQDSMVKQNAHQAKSVTPGEIPKAVSEILQAIQSKLGTDFPLVLEKLSGLQKIYERDQSQVTTMHNLAPSTNSPTNSEAAVTPLANVDLGPVIAKLDELLGREWCTEIKEIGKIETSGKADEKSEELAKILSLIDEDRDQRAVQAQQQADSVRYLNELNAWLESFVHNGTSQIQGLTDSISKLCRELGCDSKRTSIPRPPENGTGLLSDIRQLVDNVKARDQEWDALRTSVNGLIEVFNSESRNDTGAESAIAALIERQHHDQEALFRAFTEEISGEIKGERLRFVEAMKEATAINVQIHVEQFKKELTREVMGMTEEVGRLHREKHIVENQIADLFAFYSKQKQAGAVMVPSGVTQSAVQTHDHVQRIPRTRPLRRPLPQPGRP